ncbi:hypothetical protein ACE6H2_006858 [Prunus campanulata]
MEVLHKNNYMHWSVLVKNYLLAQDLWDAVEATAEPPKGEDQDSDDRLKTWRKKNAMALHTIQISCGPEAFSVIRDMTSAKIAWDWDTLAERLTPQPLLPCNSPVQSTNSSNNPAYKNRTHGGNRAWSGKPLAPYPLIAALGQHPLLGHVAHPQSTSTIPHRNYQQIAHLPRPIKEANYPKIKITLPTEAIRIPKA